MKEFIDKLISRLETMKVAGSGCNGVLCEKCKYNDMCMDGELSFKVALDNVILFVNQLAEEYKGSWISCDKELPTTEGTYWATLHDVQSGYEYVRRVHWNSFFKRWLWDNGKPLSNLIEVVAWQNINRPEPYTEGVRK